MKKSVILTMLATSAILLTACNQSKNTENSSSVSSMDSSVKMSSTKESSSTEKSSSSEVRTSSSSEDSTDSTTTATKESVAQMDAPAQQADTVLSELAGYFPAPLPDAILTSQSGQYLSAATTSTHNQQDFRILYYAEDHVVAVNAPEVNGLTPIASFEKATYGSNEEAKQAVGKTSGNDGAKTVDLGYGITGYMQGAAGSNFLSWEEGNWTIVVQASTVEGEEPVALAKSVVDYLETAALPAPNTAGQIDLGVSVGDYQRNEVKWQKENVVYKVTHSDPIQAVKMAVSTK